MILIMIYGYWKPYKTKIINYLEIGLLMIFLFLLKLRVNKFLQDVLSDALDSQVTSVPACDGGAITVTRLSAILSFVYYIAPLVGLICLFVMISLHL